MQNIITITALVILFGKLQAITNLELILQIKKILRKRGEKLDPQEESALFSTKLPKELEQEKLDEFLKGIKAEEKEKIELPKDKELQAKLNKYLETNISKRRVTVSITGQCEVSNIAKENPIKEKQIVII